MLKMCSLLKFGLAAFLVLQLSACSNYSLNINEKVVYMPPTVFTRFQLADLELQKCVDDTISEEMIVAAKDLHTVRCPNKGIRTLNGLEIFSGIKVLGLEGNDISEIDTIGKLTNLEQLNLADNGVNSVEALKLLSKLRYLNLSGNEGVECAEIKEISLVKGGKALLPKHCEQG